MSITKIGETRNIMQVVTQKKYSLAGWQLYFETIKRVQQKGDFQRLLTQCFFGVYRDYTKTLYRVLCSVASSPTYTTIAKCGSQKKNQEIDPRGRNVVGRLMSVFTAGQARECDPNIKQLASQSETINVVFREWSLYRCEWVHSRHQKAGWRSPTSPLCWAITEDLTSLWLKMTLATWLTLARSPR